ncbi:MAG: histidine--tRNA ligase [Phycisphaerae bacterium]
MTESSNKTRIIARRLKGFRDIAGGDLLARDRMIARIREVYERYGFLPLETPALEYVDALGKYLPEADQPDGGIFAFRDEDDEWVALRYDLTAPLSRFVAMNPGLPTPYRRYQVGPLYRVEKPGPGRFREFYQFDFDSVGTASMLADAECCMVMCDTLEALGIKRGDYVIRVNDRKVLNGALERVVGGAGLPGGGTPLRILRSIDKLDRVGLEGVQLLLGPGRRDESGDFTPGAGLSASQIEGLVSYLKITSDSRSVTCSQLEKVVGGSRVGLEGVNELREIDQILTEAGYADDRVVFDPTVVRGLEYYTGPVFEGVLTLELLDEQGQARSFGSVVGGGRYDNLIERFTGQSIPATGASIGVDRLLAVLQALRKVDVDAITAPVLVTRLDKNLTGEYIKLAAEVRSAGINAELYVGKQNIGKQFKYASDSGKTVALIMGSDEQARGEVAIKDLRLGDELSKEIGADRKKWLEEQPAQFSVRRTELVTAVKKVLARYAIG